jgi:hypothetical protein
MHPKTLVGLAVVASGTAMVVLGLFFEGLVRYGLLAAGGLDLALGVWLLLSGLQQGGPDER